MILNRQGRRSAKGERFTRVIVKGLRQYRNIPSCKPSTEPPSGELLSVDKAAEQLDVAPSTLHRWLQAGFIAGEQDTPGAPWRIRINDQLRCQFVENAPPGYVPILDAMRILGVSRPTVLQRVKRGELQALHVRTGRRKGLRILVPPPEHTLFDTTRMNGKAVRQPIEGACKNLIRDRFERSGMRWTCETAEALLRLRAVYLSGDLDGYWAHHIKRDQQRLHPPWQVVLN
jgi:hypothetical protein